MKKTTDRTFREQSLCSIIWLLPGILYPYCMLLFLYGIFTGRINELFPSITVIDILLCLGALFLIAAAGNILFMARHLAGKYSAANLPFINLLIKLIHIPAYLLIFALGLLCMITIFTMGFSLFFVFFDCLTICLSGMIGLLAVSTLYRSGKCTGPFLILRGILQFIFVADIISAVIIYRRAKNSSFKNDLQRPK